MGRPVELTAEERGNAGAADAFLSPTKTVREAAGEFPRLAGPLATLGAYSAALERQGIDPAQRSTGVERMRAELATRILTGQYPSVQTRQAQFPNRPTLAGEQGQEYSP